MHSEKLDKKKHNRKTFDCGVEALNNYLKLMANQHATKDNSRTYVIVDEESNIIGFYTLAMANIDLGLLPKEKQLKHCISTQAGLIARLAVDKRYSKKGYGKWLLVDALLKLIQASDIVAFPMIVVDAKDGVVDFYTQFGFSPFTDELHKLFISVTDVRKSFGS
jgi:N-acetylglutamate synthase-like GNAT family acetyltransferase